MKHFFGAWEIPVPKPSQSQPKPSQFQPKPSQFQPKPSLVTIASWGPGGRPKGCFLNPPFMHESTGKLTHFFQKISQTLVIFDVLPKNPKKETNPTPGDSNPHSLVTGQKSPSPKRIVLAGVQSLSRNNTKRV